MRELLLALAGLVAVIGLVAITTFSADRRPRIAPPADIDIPAEFRGPNIVWEERLPGAKTRTLSVEKDERHPEGCAFEFRFNIQSGQDGRVTYTLAQNPDTCDSLMETITFDPNDPEVSTFFQIGPSSGIPIPAGSNSPPPKPASNPLPLAD